ncbi:MAG: NUDIX hydrolase [Pseudomonadales bacterium]|nr:NUDIX hydrolase [Pseudomonadales bacterium]
MKNPWKTLSTALKYENPWIKVEEHQVINPAGKPGIYGTVTFKNTAVGILPLFENGDTLIVGQHRYPLDQYHWEIPMGGAPAGEDCLETAKRELQEETGYSASRWQLIVHAHLSNSITQEQGFVYVAKDLKAGEMNLEETEDITVKRLPFDEVFTMAMDGEITDSLSVNGILKARLLGIC